jgi:hypothetical protein
MSRVLVLSMIGAYPLPAAHVSLPVPAMAGSFRVRTPYLAGNLPFRNPLTLGLLRGECLCLDYLVSTLSS